MPEVNNGSTVLTRVRYYKGQALTAQDFMDEQKYHSEKLRLLLKRFPAGIIDGLVVTQTEGGINVSTGVGATENGDLLAVIDTQQVYVGDEELVVKDEFLFIPQASWNINDLPLYVNLSLKEYNTVKSTSFCDSKAKENRIEERVKITFDKSPDGPDSDKNAITLAVLEKVTDDPYYKVNLNSPVIINARIIEEDQVKFSEIAGHDHSGGINGSKIGIQSFNMESFKLQESNITFINSGHDHSEEGKGRKIGTQSIDLLNFKLPENNIAFSADGHDHSGEANGQLIKAQNLDMTGFKLDEDKVNFANNFHDHSGGDKGHKIGITSFDTTTFKLPENNVSFINDGHDHSGGEKGKMITLSGVNLSGLPEENISFDDSGGHNHSGFGGNGSKIDSNGIANWTSDTTGIKKEHIRNHAVSLEKLDSNLKLPESNVLFKNTGHDHSGGDNGKQINSSGIAFWTSDTTGIKKEHIHDHAVSLEKLDPDLKLPEGNILFSGEGHDHSGNAAGELIKSNGIAANAILSDHISNADPNGVLAQANTEHGTGIRTNHLRNYAVTNKKIGPGAVLPQNLNIVEELINDSIEIGEPSKTITYTLPENAIVIVLPLEQGELSWKTDSIVHEPPGWTHTITIISKDVTKAVKFSMRAICFNILEPS